METLLALLASMTGASFWGFTYLASANVETLKNGQPSKAKGKRLTPELSRRTVNRISGNVADWVARQYMASIEALANVDTEAATIVRASYQTSLTVGVGNHPLYRLRDTFAQTEIDGVSVNLQTGELSILCLSHAKRVVIPARWTGDGSMSETERLRRSLPAGRIRRFTLSNLTGEARLMGDTVDMGTKGFPVTMFPRDLVQAADIDAMRLAGVLMPPDLVALGWLDGATVAR